MQLKLTARTYLVTMNVPQLGSPEGPEGGGGAGRGGRNNAFPEGTPRDFFSDLLLHVPAACAW